jgi:colanic acid biosynthesis glycosyl transferase WcaI
MKILILTPYYSPDLGPSAPMFHLLSIALVQLGHRVTVVSMVPHYPSGQVLESYKRRWIKSSLEDGVEVIRIPIPSLDRENLKKRMVQFAIYQIVAMFATISRKFDCTIISNPFFCSLFPLIWHSIIRKTPTIYSVYDVYPDVGIQLGIFKRKSVISLVTTLERFCLTHSTMVQILSDSFKKSITAMGVLDENIALIYPWVDLKLIHPLPQNNTFTQEYGLNNQFNVLYAGNIGLSQGFEHILGAAELLINHPEVHFVFVGEGTVKTTLQKQVEQRSLKNIHFIAFQPRERLPEVLASADVSLVVLRQGMGVNSLPSKIFSIMASGRPILVSVDAESESWKLLKQADAGMWVAPEDAAELAEAIISLKNDSALCERLGYNGRNWVEQHHSPEYAADQFEHFLELAIRDQRH